MEVIIFCEMCQCDLEIIGERQYQHHKYTLNFLINKFMQFCPHCNSSVHLVLKVDEIKAEKVDK